MVTNSNNKIDVDELSEQLKQIRITRNQIIKELEKLNKAELDLIRKGASAPAATYTSSINNPGKHLITNLSTTRYYK